jgi:hypothetical protein
MRERQVATKKDKGTTEGSESHIDVVRARDRARELVGAREVRVPDEGRVCKEVRGSKGIQ